MRRQKTRRGFTIIEVMLFLAITGLMMLGILAAVTGGINRQRYDDAVASLSDFMQGQYSLVDNVITNRPDSIRCTAGGIDESGTGSVQPRGTSDDCTIIGRYITSDDGEKLRSRPVYATVDITTLPNTLTPSELINQLKLTTASSAFDVDDVTYNIAWSTYVYTSKQATNRGSGDFSMVLLKMPDSGLMRTYAMRSGGRPVQEVIDNAMTEPLLMCVATDGLVNSPPVGIKLLQLAANTAGVQPVLGTSGECS